MEILTTRKIEHSIVKRFPEFYGWEEFLDDNNCLIFTVNSNEDKFSQHLFWVTFEDNPEKLSKHAHFIFGTDSESESANRADLDISFEIAAQNIINIFQMPSEYGEYVYDDEPDFPYRYIQWKKKEVTFTLVQAYFDRQVGRDITLWALPRSMDLKPPIEPYES